MVTRERVIEVLRKALRDMPVCWQSKHGCCDDMLPGKPELWCPTCQVGWSIRAIPTIVDGS